jgi:hemoglobin-like flavoprotein
VTPDQIRLVEGTVEGIGRHPEFAGRFYARLFEAEPRIEAMFPDIAAQERKLADELTAMVSLLGDLPSLDARARELGARHRGYGVRAGDYRLVRKVMAEALEEVLGEEFGADEEAAWDRATNLITELMMAG